MFKFNNKMLSESFNSYFTKLDNVHKHFTRQKHRNEYHQFHTSSESYLFKCVENFSKRVSTLFIFSIQNIPQKEYLNEIYSTRNFDFFKNMLPLD